MEKIPQVIGCAYTFQGSLGIRKKLTASLIGKLAYHSSQERDFSYFYKGNSATVVFNGDELRLRDENEIHWPEAELALILGNRHDIIGYSLSNDFTAIGIEVKGRTQDFDGTYFGKVWNGSCSLGPRLVSPDEIDINDLDIGLRIYRRGSVIYDNKYNTQRRKRDFSELAEMIVEYHREFGINVPPSKRIETKDGFLVEGSVILAGTGLIVPKRCYSQKGDLVTVYNQHIGELVNKIN